MSRNGIPSDDALEADSLAPQLARAYHRMAAYYRDQLELPGQDADTRARGADRTPEEAIADLERLRDRPPEQVSWFDLAHLAEHDPDTLASVWHDIKTAARRELASGHRTAGALEWQGRPWARARFLALRDSFQEPGPAPHGIEAALVDSAAEAFSDYLGSTEHLHMLTSVDMESEQARADREGVWRPQHLSYAASVDRAARMADQAHARFLRTIKMLHEIRKFAPAVYVEHAGQINVAHQQVNVATDQPAHIPDD